MMQHVWHWSLKPLLMAVSILLGVVTIKFVYYLCFERGNRRKDSMDMALVFITCILETSWASLQPEMRLCLRETFRSCAYIIMASTGH